MDKQLLNKGSIFRTGTGLWVVCRPLVIPVLVLASLSASADEGVQPRTAQEFTRQLEPGAIGVSRPSQRGPRSEMIPITVQPVEIMGPPGLSIAIETASGWSVSGVVPLRMGLVVGHPYRLRLTNIQGHDGEELYPSICLLSKLVTPAGMVWRFPVEVLIEQDDLEQALQGSLVRRAVYVSCEAESPASSSFDVQPGDDCLAVASTLGDPVAEVVIGNRVPTQGGLP